MALCAATHAGRDCVFTKRALEYREREKARAEHYEECTERKHSSLLLSLSLPVATKRVTSPIGVLALMIKAPVSARWSARAFSAEFLQKRNASAGVIYRKDRWRSPRGTERLLVETETKDQWSVRDSE